MNTNYLIQAINNLRPGAQFSLSNNDYETIKWDVLQGDAPSFDEIEVEIENIKIKETQNKELAEQKRIELLDRLGITEEELKLLFS